MPPWACKQWGQYEHDWLDCPDCIEQYESSLNDPESYEEQSQEEAKGIEGI